MSDSARRPSPRLPLIWPRDRHGSKAVQWRAHRKALAAIIFNALLFAAAAAALGSVFVPLQRKRWNGGAAGTLPPLAGLLFSLEFIWARIGKMQSAAFGSWHMS